MIQGENMVNITKVEERQKNILYIMMPILSDAPTLLHKFPVRNLMAIISDVFIVEFALIITIKPFSSHFRWWGIGYGEFAIL